MKSRDASFFELFQDPLFTMIAIVLMGTVWIIVPERSTPADQKVLIVKDELSSLKAEITLKEQQIERLKNERSNLDQKLTNMKDTTERHAVDAMKLKTEIALLEKDIDGMRREKNELEEKLKKAKNISSIMESINRLEKEIEKKRQELSQLDERLKNTMQGTEHNQKQKELIAKLQAELKALLDEIKELEAKVKDNKGTGGKFKSVFESNKEPIPFELVNNRLFPIDGDYYDAERSSLRMQGGGTTVVVVATRKSSAQGESVDQIQNLESIFQKKLEKGSAENHRVMFIVHGNSFEILRVARQIAMNKNYEISWWPNEANELIFGSGGAEVPSTGGSGKR